MIGNTVAVPEDSTLDAERFGERFAASTKSAPRAVELEALGTDYSATGYTTREQADDLGHRLDLGPDKVLLDLGAGCGWPGLYLAGEFGCSVISTDPIMEGTIAARERIERDGLGSAAIVVVATGEHLPLRPRSIDAVVHADVLC